MTRLILEPHKRRSVCLSCVSGAGRLAPPRRDQDPEPERPLRRLAEARAQKRERARQPRAEGKDVHEAGVRPA